MFLAYNIIALQTVAGVAPDHSDLDIASVSEG